jgi:hypothetical protein
MLLHVVVCSCLLSLPGFGCCHCLPGTPSNICNLCQQMILLPLLLLLLLL